jgi:hypothetical protein
VDSRRALARELADVEVGVGGGGAAPDGCDGARRRPRGRALSAKRSDCEKRACTCACICATPSKTRAPLIEQVQLDVLRTRGDAGERRARGALRDGVPEALEGLELRGPRARAARLVQAVARGDGARERDAWNYGPKASRIRSPLLVRRQRCAFTIGRSSSGANSTRCSRRRRSGEDAFLQGARRQDRVEPREQIARSAHCREARVLSLPAHRVHQERPHAVRVLLRGPRYFDISVFVVAGVPIGSYSFVWFAFRFVSFRFFSFRFVSFHRNRKGLGDKKDSAKAKYPLTIISSRENLID